MGHSTSLVRKTGLVKNKHPNYSAILPVCAHTIQAIIPAKMVCQNAETVGLYGLSPSGNRELRRSRMLFH